MAESFAILVVEPGKAQLNHFNVELRGETLWTTGTDDLAKRLSRARPELVAVAGDEGAARDLAEQLRRLGVAQSVFLITPADGETVNEPGQIRVALPETIRMSGAERLLRYLIEAVLNVQARTPVSALTGLPGSPVLHQEVDRRLAASTPFVFLYLDLDNFKAYNDAYGFGRGDIAIRLLASEVVAAVKEFGAADDLCVHIGGDDFAILTTAQDYAQVARRIIVGFAAGVPALYSEDDRTRGFIETRSRRGELTRYPLMTVSIGGVNLAVRHIAGYLQLTETAAEVKGYAKALEGNQFVMDRRRD
ncbi:MAG: GGDEF domain-containing protein [Armatimonadota bacterium]|jgi:GGDEF domain-containing protein